MTSHSRWIVLSLFVPCLITVAGCEEEVSVNEERIRAIKPYYVSEPAGGAVHRYSGTIAAASTSSLSFAVSGTVQKVRVKQGQRVKKGQALATLDPKPFEIDVQAAKSDLQTAGAGFAEKQLELERQRKLFERGWVAKAAYDQALAAFESAEGSLNLARSRLASAERDLAKTRLTAPFDGTIAERTVDPFVEVLSGQSLFSLKGTSKNAQMSPNRGSGRHPASGFWRSVAPERLI